MISFVIYLLNNVEYCKLEMRKLHESSMKLCLYFWRGYDFAQLFHGEDIHQFFSVVHIV